MTESGQSCNGNNDLTRIIQKIVRVTMYEANDFLESYVANQFPHTKNENFVGEKGILFELFCDTSRLLRSGTTSLHPIYRLLFHSYLEFDLRDV